MSVTGTSGSTMTSPRLPPPSQNVRDKRSVQGVLRAGRNAQCRRLEPCPRSDLLAGYLTRRIEPHLVLSDMLAAPGGKTGVLRRTSPCSTACTTGAVILER